MFLISTIHSDALVGLAGRGIRLGRRLGRFFVFSAVGLTVMLAATALLVILVDVLGLSVALAYAIQVVVAVNLNFALNYSVTWRDRRATRRPGTSPMVRQWLLFVSSRAVTIALTVAIFAGLATSVHYLIAQVLSIAIPTVLNYLVNDRYVFGTRAAPGSRDGGGGQQPSLSRPDNCCPVMGENDRTLDLSIILPVKGNLATVCETVESLLTQEFDGDYEVIVVVDHSDPSRLAIRSRFRDPRLSVVVPRQAFPYRGRDSNWRRGLGLAQARGRILALTDADMVLGPDWAQKGVQLLRAHPVHCVAGLMTSCDPGSFWGSYVDTNCLGAKTPRYVQPFLLTRGNFGTGRTKPGVTANMFFTRAVLSNAGFPRPDFLYTYEDYAFFYDIVSAGYSVLCTPELTAVHHHRCRIRSLIWEYWNSGQGCADFVSCYPQAGFSKARKRQLAAVAAATVSCVAGLVVLPAAAVAVLAICLALLGLWNVARLRVLHAVLFGAVTLLLGLSFSWGFLQGTIRGGPPLVVLPSDWYADVRVDSLPEVVACGASLAPLHGTIAAPS